jgi:malic enzyme/CRP-like cAMP-binding protein
MDDAGERGGYHVERELARRLAPKPGGRNASVPSRAPGTGGRMDEALLDRCEALRDLTGAERRTILALGREVAFDAGARIIEEGSAGTCFFVILEGQVEILKGDQPIAELGAGAILGEMALFNRDLRTSEARCRQRCTLLSIPIADFVRLVLQQDAASVKVMGTLGRLMVQRLQVRDADLLRQASREDPSSAVALEEFAALRKALLTDWALRYHSIGVPGKLCIVPAKPVGTAADLAVAYSPGVAEPCLEIARDPARAYDYTTRSHLVGVITNGTAVLGLGNIGALASKPVMEGKAVLFKRFADLDAFDIEVDETDPARLVDIVCALAPTFGGINLEDIRAPECFAIETQCQQRLDIPVFHDDQHGTAIVAGAALLNAAELVDKPLARIRVVFSGAGAAGFTCAKYFLSLGIRRENLLLTDKDGVVYQGRGDGNYLDELAATTDARSLAQAIEGADVFVGVSAPNVLTPAMLLSMNRDPIVFALANPIPEIDYRLAVTTRNDVVMATGRSDYPNQVNNVIAFPYIFRGALDVRARAINEEMKLAATAAIAALAREPVTAEAGLEVSTLSFGRAYLIPKPFDRRLLARVPVAVAEAAARTGMARAALDPEQYRARLARSS